MAVPGPVPMDAGEKRFRGGLTHDWVSVVDEPFEGPVPVELPTTRTLYDKEGPYRVRLTKQTKAWWAVTSSMPHCRLWTESDWLFALETALIADTFYRSGHLESAKELRQRSKILGTTADARRSLRIRYVAPDDRDQDGGEESEPARNAEKGKVTSIQARRKRLTSDAS